MTRLFLRAAAGVLLAGQTACLQGAALADRPIHVNLFALDAPNQPPLTPDAAAGQQPA